MYNYPLLIMARDVVNVDKSAVQPLYDFEKNQKKVIAGVFTLTSGALF